MYTSRRVCIRPIAYHLLMGMLILTCIMPVPSSLPLNWTTNGLLSRRSRSPTWNRFFYRCDFVINAQPTNCWCNRGAASTVKMTFTQCQVVDVAYTPQYMCESLESSSCVNLGPAWFRRLTFAREKCASWYESTSAGIWKTFRVFKLGTLPSR